MSKRGRPKKKEVQEMTNENIDDVNKIVNQEMDKNITISGIPLDTIKHVDKAGNGSYYMKLTNGSSLTVNLDPGEQEIIESHFRLSATDDAGSLEGLPPELAQLLANASPLERNLGNWMNAIQWKDPRYHGYWPTQDKVDRYARLGYIYAKPEMIANYNELFCGANPGMGADSNGFIKYGNHILMVTIKDQVKKIENKFYRDRPIQNVKTSTVF